MILQRFAFMGVPAMVVALVWVAPIQVAGQGQLDTEKKVGTSIPAPTWTPPRTVWGDPDIQGMWINHTITPFERPVELGDREFLTDEEFAQMEQRIKNGESLSIHAVSDNRRYSPPEQFGPPPPPAPVAEPNACSFAVCWEPGNANRRTSVIVEPKNGRLPPRTPEGDRRAADRRMGAGTDIDATAIDAGYQVNGPEDLGSWVRCLSRGLPNAMVPAAYGGVYQIMQRPGAVVIVLEMIHETRTIPLDGRPHIDGAIRQWMGDPRGRWEGNTLVVETTNFTDRTTFNGTGRNLRLIERYTPTGPDTMDYRFTVIDPEMFTQQWTAVLPMTRERGTFDRVMEYACHEGNYAPEIFLKSARQREKEAGQR